MTSSPNSAPVAPPHIAIRPDWLARHVEEALEPGLPIIDAHHHLWEREGNPYRAEDYLADVASGHNIRASVFVECKTNYAQDGEPEFAPLGESRFAEEQALKAAELGGEVNVAAVQVGFADLALGRRAGEVLDALAASSADRLRGIRNIAVWHADPNVRPSAATPPPGLLADASFRAGFAELAPRSLVFDAWLIHTQLSELVDLAAAFPETTIALNHVGGPLALGPYRGRRSEVMAEWEAGISKLADRQNVFVKLGGFGMPLFGFDFERNPHPPTSEQIAEAIRSYVEACIMRFGAERCMFESNFPVDKGSFGYGVLWNAFKRVTAALPASDRDMLFSDTARRVYRIP